MMFEEELIQIGLQLLCKQSKQQRVVWAGGSPPHDVRRIITNRVVVMLMMREAKSKNQ